MNTTAKALVGRDNDEELALPRLLSWSVIENLCRTDVASAFMKELPYCLLLTRVGDTVFLSSLHGALRLSEFC